jgi:hypothetical protein
MNVVSAPLSRTCQDSFPGGPFGHSETGTQAKQSALRELCAHHPRFWWRASLSLDGKRLVDLFLDATGIARSFPLQMAIWRDETFALAVKRELEDATKVPVILAILTTDRFLQFLLKSIQNRLEPATLLAL